MTASERAHIAMFCIAAHGHVNPSLDIIRELVARGHRVSYAIPAIFAEKIAATGAEPVVYTSVLPTPDDDPSAWGTELVDNLEPFLTDAVQALPQLADAFEDDRPDLVLGDTTSFPAPVLARRWGVPFLQFSTHMVAWEGYEKEVGEPMLAALDATERGRAYRARFAGWLRENGMDRTERDFLTGRRHERTLALIPRALQHRADLVDESAVTFVGSCRPAPADQEEWHRPAGAEKVLLVSLGSAFTKQPAFYRACVEAFGGLPGWHVVLQIGKNVEESELGPVPANIEVSPWVPQLSVLRQADAFITHAGAGGSQEGLATATPMVAVPQAADQFGNADTLVSLGVARRIDMADATPEALRAAVLALAADPSVAERLGAIRREMAAEGGTRGAADLIEEALSVGAPIVAP
ncbi:macrolide family glycosyltransferase [Streptomyces paludis]|uniref:Glycosyl transferase n=1 Tax=Streptomyces paludis TaxID=2282738 RepID=A0A345HWB1_9ACTN|nr:macrolide family glycosyltransferase [Streptomyces paludis]AXG80985.1 glycosyl transferase [Streptomyces paludis]